MALPIVQNRSRCRIARFIGKVSTREIRVVFKLPIIGIGGGDVASRYPPKTQCPRCSHVKGKRRRADGGVVAPSSVIFDSVS